MEFRPQTLVSFVVRTQVQDLVSLNRMHPYEPLIVSKVRRQALLEAWHSAGAATCRNMWLLEVAAFPQWFLAAVTAVSFSVAWGGSSNSSHGSFLIGPVLQRGSEFHSWEFSLEPVLHSSPKFPG